MSGGAAQTHGTARELTPYCPVAADIERRSRDVSVVRWTIGLALMAYCAVRRWPSHRSRRRSITIFRKRPPHRRRRRHPRTKPRRSLPQRPRRQHHVTVPPSPSSSCCCESSCGCENGCCSSCCGCDSTGAWATASAIAAWAMLGRCKAASLLLLRPPRTAAGFRPATTTTTSGCRSARADLLSFNDNPDELNFDQAWFYTEKVADADGCCCGLGLSLRHAVRRRRPEDPSLRQRRRHVGRYVRSRLLRLGHPASLRRGRLSAIGA